MGAAGLVIALAATAASTSPEVLARRVEQVRRRAAEVLPGRVVTVVAQAPFVVAGDGDPESVRRAASRLVGGSVAMLREQFFRRAPERVVEVWLFRDAGSYQTGVKALFGHYPDTPYGFFLARADAIVMNIATGGGTLLHELVHPLLEADFPNCPPWLNEGLASLFEQSTERDGRLVGLPNWRLPALQAALRVRQVPSFRVLTTMNRGEFYNKDKGTNYAQARYLCLYLQEKGVLSQFYRRLRDRWPQDPHGLQTALEVLGEKDAATLRARWEAFVAGLRFPE